MHREAEVKRRENKQKLKKQGLKEEEIKDEPVKMEISSFTKNGEMIIKFNQPLMLPPFIRSIKNY